jgi:hypothetical protein
MVLNRHLVTTLTTSLQPYLNGPVHAQIMRVIIQLFTLISYMDLIMMAVISGEKSASLYSLFLIYINRCESTFLNTMDSQMYTRSGQVVGEVTLRHDRIFF